MASASIIHNTPRNPVPEFEEERLKADEESAALDARIERIETRPEDSNNGQSASPESNPQSINELKRIVNEIIDKLGPLSDDEVKVIREWLELGS